MNYQSRITNLVTAISCPSKHYYEFIATGYCLKANCRWPKAKN